MMTPRRSIFHATLVTWALVVIAGCDASCPSETNGDASGSGGGPASPGGAGSGGFDAQAFPECSAGVGTHLRGTLNGFVLDEWFYAGALYISVPTPSYVRIYITPYGAPDTLTASRIDLKWDWTIKLDADHWTPVTGLMLLPNDPTVYRVKPDSKLFLRDNAYWLYELVMDEGHLFGCSH
jgi:hypothetical protein